MYKIQTLNKISSFGLDKFDAAKYEVADKIENPDAILVRSAAMHDMELGDNLLAIARAGAGVNNIPVDRCSEQGIVVFNTPGANANAVKELVIAALLLSSRRIPDALIWAQTLKGKGDEVGKLVEKGKSAFVGPEICGKKLGVIGLGAIGVMAANTAEHLGMEVYGYDPYLSVKAAWGLSSSVHYAKSLRDIYENCDYISLHVPLNAETKGMINSEALASMKDDVRIINLARGELVNDTDIIAALESGKAAQYVTDFPSDTVLGAKNVIALPHLGASTPESEDNCATMAAAELIEYLENGNILNSVNLPNAEMVAEGDAKVCVIHKNVVARVTNITGRISDMGLNIENMINK
ncbi:MAG TPA: 3-phosphoglycerate dehydrogenase, partial [Oscillospiraceae bacterium]|nr:3-phosphoglycerate dehydrogenase [Oscillospiraceae bacterium]